MLKLVLVSGLLVAIVDDNNSSVLATGATAVAVQVVVAISRIQQASRRLTIR